MDYKFIFISALNRPRDRAFVYSFEVKKVGDYVSGLRGSITEWQRRKPGQNLLENGGTLLIEHCLEETYRNGSRPRRGRSLAPASSVSARHGERRSGDR